MTEPVTNPTETTSDGKELVAPSKPKRTRKPRSSRKAAAVGNALGVVEHPHTIASVSAD